MGEVKKLCKTDDVNNNIDNIKNRDINNINDSVLTDEVKMGSEEAFKILAEKYDRVITYNLSRITVPAGAAKWSDKEDLYQECRIVLYKAAKRYDSLKCVKFSTYANVCVKNYLASFFRKYGGEEVCASLEDIPENELSSYDVYDFSDFDNMFEILTSFERRVLLLYIEQKSYKHIAEILNKNVKSINNAVCRIKNKLKPYAGHFIKL